MSSIIRGSDNFDSAGGNALKAWVNFNGTGVVAIRASYNVSSITDNATGDYTLNFTTPLIDSNYSVGGATVVSAVVCVTTILANSLKCSTNTTSSGNYIDSATVLVQVFR